MADPIRVLVVDDQPIIRAGVRALLGSDPAVRVIGEASDGAEAVALAARLHPDVVLMDLVMPQLDGIAATSSIVARHPGVRVIVLSAYDTDDKLFPAIRAGAHGYLLKDASLQELSAAIQRVIRGDSALHPGVARRVLQELAQPPQRPGVTPLTDREQDVLRLLARGESNHEIALVLGIGEGTVRVHVSNILSKLHLASRTQAALYALREGLVSIDDE